MRPASVLRQPAYSPAILSPARGEGRRGTGRWLGRILTATCASLLVIAIALAVAPRFLPIQTFTVLSGSMRPTIPVGAIVVSTPVSPKSLRVGDIVTFTSPTNHDRLITHRIRQVSQTPSGPVFETQGDANAAADAWELRATSPVYRHLFHVPYLGYLVVASQSPVVRLAVLLLGALGFVLLWWRSEEG